jgi:c-di-GMP-binding flagellar brake protein YcgR
MFLDTQPAQLDATGGTDSLGEFRVSNTTEVVSLLRQLRDGSVAVNLAAPDGTSYTTSLWSYDSAQKRVSFSANEQHTQLQRLVDADEVVAVAYLDAVKLQFDVHDLVLVRSAMSCALHGTFPRNVYRFQRRSGYRVRTPERSSPTARFRHTALPDMMLGLRVLDVSIGGCALLLPADVPPLQAGSTLQGVHVDLDPDTRFESSVQLHHVSSLSNGTGARLGCEWLRMDGAAQRALQRYIDQTQKRRRLLSLT